ncbi:MAG: sugar ABC transporter permease [Anaerolineae bacterium]|nr:sugar ABC transporter permease [Anaerolineae bacterium]
MNLKKVNWAPYLLILPSFLYLMLFFGWPMIRSMELAFRRDSQILPLRTEPFPDSATVGKLERGAEVTILDVIKSEESSTGGLLSKKSFWLKISGIDVEGNEIEGWAERGPVFVRDASRSEEGRVVDSSVTVYAEPDETGASVGELPQGTEVTITDWDELEGGVVAGGLLAKPAQWFKITAETADGDTLEGWVKRGPVFVEDTRISTTGRVDKGEGAKEWTLDYIKRMVNDRRFTESLRTTVLLMVLILPVQFTLAIIMALVLQSRLKGNTIFLYIFSIPLGVSDLAAGLVWFSIFTQRGFLNSFLERLGLIDKPYIFISNENKQYIILAIVLAEVWRATSIVMVIVVSGLQAIPGELIEAGQLFGANLWQRLRHIILPLLMPSLQVALILRTILAFQVFAVVVAISGGEVVTVLANETYRWYEVGTYNNPNVAAAYAGFIMLISLGVAVFYLRAVRTQEERATQK